MSYQYVKEKCYGSCDGLDARVAAVKEQDPSQCCLVKQRYLDGQAYLANLCVLQNVGTERGSEIVNEEDQLQ